MSNISQFLGGAPKRILRGATFVTSSGGVNIGTVNTGIFVDPQKSYIVSSYSGAGRAFVNESSGLSYGVIMDGSGTAYISTSGEVVVNSGAGVDGLPSPRRFDPFGTTSLNSAATVHWQVVEY